ncbi:RnfABCDGE type electron transport complex subunit E [Cellulosilyticum sp. I15G10I2]|uniref:RnfABCDGE type electron transport complex subunit E n=1 Tax=Cellulosilyticum sp. I15G10I2 TaxID=1892843 RepID=UPI00085BBC30|nr:electron transport complex subunit E [Cellulosilyticum sp. I15G10I2]
MNIIKERLKAGIVIDNPIFMQVLGMCPTLAVTTSGTNAIGMGLATTAVLIGSNLVISLLRKCIPSKIRIPAFIVIIASFVTMVDLVLQAYIQELHASLGLFIPLIVVNCIILGRAEAYASKNNIISSFFDAIGMGLGFTVSLTIIGVIREILGTGELFGRAIMPAQYNPAIIMILAPGAFFTLGLLMALLNALKARKN